jgi:hypothetical protein
MRIMERGKCFLRHFHKGGTPQNNAPTVPEPPAQEYDSEPDPVGSTYYSTRYYEPPRIDQYVFNGSPVPLTYGTQPLLPGLEPMPFIKENAGSETSHTVSPSNG